MKVTKDTKIISKNTMKKALFKELIEADQSCADDPNNEDSSFDVLQANTENLLAFHSYQARKWVNIGGNLYVPLTDYEKHCHPDGVGGVATDNGVTRILL